MLNKEIRLGSLHLVIYKGKFTFLFKCRLVEFDNRAITRDSSEFIVYLLRILNRLKPTLNVSSSRTIIRTDIGTNVTLEIILCTLTDTIISIGLCDTEMKTNVSILLIDNVVEFIDLSDGYVNDITTYPTNEKAVSMFINQVCERISYCSPMDENVYNPNVGLDNYNPIL